jgi:hypothetical protein
MTTRNVAAWERPPSTVCQPRFCQARACRNSAGPTPASGSTAARPARPAGSHGRSGPVPPVTAARAQTAAPASTTARATVEALIDQA